jgi:hypothetical protein
MIDITLRTLFRPDPANLPTIYRTLGNRHFAENILESIGNEVLKSVVAQFNAAQLITKRELVSQLIRKRLTERAADFNIELDDVSIVCATMGFVGCVGDVIDNVILLLLLLLLLLVGVDSSWFRQRVLASH